MIYEIVDGSAWFIIGGMFLGMTLWILLLAALIWALITWLQNHVSGSPQRQPLPSSGEPSQLKS